MTIEPIDSTESAVAAMVNRCVFLPTLGRSGLWGDLRGGSLMTVSHAKRLYATEHATLLYTTPTGKPRSATVRAFDLLRSSGKARIINNTAHVYGAPRITEVDGVETFNTWSGAPTNSLPSVPGDVSAYLDVCNLIFKPEELPAWHAFAAEVVFGSTVLPYTYNFVDEPDQRSLSGPLLTALHVAISYKDSASLNNHPYRYMPVMPHISSNRYPHFYRLAVNYEVTPPATSRDGHHATESFFNTKPLAYRTRYAAHYAHHPHTVVVHTTVGRPFTQLMKPADAAKYVVIKCPLLDNATLLSAKQALESFLNNGGAANLRHYYRALYVETDG